jgi:hypothetical protein
LAGKLGQLAREPLRRPRPKPRSRLDAAFRLCDFRGILCHPLRQLLLAAFLCAPIAAAQQSTTTLPQIPDPSGPYGIGRVGYHWIDMSRPDDYSPNRHRELMVYFWYPIAKSANAKGAYIPGATQMESDLNAAPPLHREFGDLWAPILSGQISSHAIDHAHTVSGRDFLPRYRQHELLLHRPH